MKKKLFAIFIAFMTLIGVTACNYDTTKPTPPAVVNPGGGDGPEKPPEDKGEPFTVKLVLGGITFTPAEYSDMAEITVYWTASDNSNIFTASFDENGVASAYGLDGDYRVSLSATPNGFTYNPNIYMATNDKKDVSIELLMLGKYTGGGTDMYTDYIKLTEARAYRAVVTEELAKHGVYFSFEPQYEIGSTYIIESIVDTAKNDVNPIVDTYNGTFAARFFDKTIDGGGISSSYTKNFLYRFSQDSTMGGNSYLFAIRADSRAGTYPVTVDFVIRREGSFETDYPPLEIVEPKEKFITVPNYSSMGYTWKDADNNGIFDGRYYAYNEEDGYYWRIDPKTGDFVTRLYAKISQAITCMGNGTALNMVTSYLASNLDIMYGDVRKSYKYFIEGGEDQNKNWHDGYALHCNEDGVYPVTQEMKNFLQDYATLKELLFADGLGWVEGNGYDAAEGDQWLFACGYYVQD